MKRRGIELEMPGISGRAFPRGAGLGYLAPSAPGTQLSKSGSHGSLARMNDTKGTLKALGADGACIGEQTRFDRAAFLLAHLFR